MKGNNIITLLLLVAVFMVLFEIETRIQDYSHNIYNRFVADITISEKQENKIPIEKSVPIFSLFKLK